MTYFTEINSTRRFVGPTGEILAIYDQCRAYTLFAPVGTIDGRVVFVAKPRTYFSDEVEEVK